MHTHLALEQRCMQAKATIENFSQLWSGHSQALPEQTTIVFETSNNIIGTVNIVKPYTVHIL